MTLVQSSMRVSGRHRLFPFIARQSKYGYLEDTTEVIHALASPITRFLLARTRSPRTFLPRSERILCLEASEYCATKHFVSLARLLLESLNYRPMVTATTWPSSQFNSVHGPISSSIFGRNSRAHHQAMPVKQGESTRLSRRGMKCVRFSSHALPFVPARKRFIRTTQISSMHDLALRFCEICFGLCPLSSIRANLGRISLLGLLLRLPSLTSPLIMFLFASLAPFVVLANAVAANPIVVRDGFVSFCKIRQRFGRTRSRPQRPGTSEEISQTGQHFGLRDEPRHRRHKHRQLLRGQRWRWHSRHLLWVLLIRASRSCLHPLFQ